jgi:hypothetical protein
MTVIRHFRLVGILLLAAVTATMVLAGNAPAAPKPPTVASFLAGSRVLGEIRHGNLTILPVESPTAAAADKLLTLDEAVPSGRLIIGEVSEGGSVNTLRVVNKSGQPVFILAGEILSGAKQNRILQADVVVPAGQDELAVPAFCVEHGRWSSQGAHFGTDSNNAPISVRQKASQTKSQGEVWSEVGANNDTVQASSSTGSLSAAYKAPAVTKAKEEYTGHFRDLPRRYLTATGVVVLIGDKVLVADLFASRRLFERLWDKLLESYIVEAARRSQESPAPKVDSAREFLALAAKAEIRTAATAGAGQGIELKTAKITGHGLALNAAPVHLALFPVTAESASERATPLQRQYPQMNQAIR